jgi:hypothetical protein
VWTRVVLACQQQRAAPNARSLPSALATFNADKARLARLLGGLCIGQACPRSAEPDQLPLVVGANHWTEMPVQATSCPVTLATIQPSCRIVPSTVADRP